MSIASTDCTDSKIKDEETANKAARTIEHGARFSRKLQRRLTRRTLAEARALKEQGTECIHVLIYVAELVATDPKLALKKAKELWASLSLPEPENQARPSNLEQLLVLFTRETARRIVHLLNGTANMLARAPRRLSHSLVSISHQLISISEQALKVIHESIYRLFADFLMLTAVLKHLHKIVNTDPDEVNQRSSANRAKRKLLFQANGVCPTNNNMRNDNVVVSTGKAADNHSANGSVGQKGLSLIAKINFVPMKRANLKKSSSFIEQLRDNGSVIANGLNNNNDDNDNHNNDNNDNGNNDKDNNKSEDHGAPGMIMRRQNAISVDSIPNSISNHHYNNLVSVNSVTIRANKPSLTKAISFNEGSLLPFMTQTERVDDKVPLFTNIKPDRSIKQEQ